ncbi:FAD-binding domain-containing protein [Atractiella rhizophila]|nr:FAD-binding domain-containing protein [Atractiella rhizophila]
MDTLIEELRKQLGASSIVLPTSSSFPPYTKQWSIHHSTLQPKVVVVPQNDSQLQGAVKLLYSSSFSFSVRSGGLVGSQNEDVILSLEAFSGFEWNEKEKTVLLGAGQVWRTVYEKMERLAPGYMVVGARVPIVGLGGSLLSGGSSWLSPQYGWGSDPLNLLDARVVLNDGREVWASEEEDGRLLWALRGGHGSFGVVKSFLLKAHPYPSQIYAGNIFFAAPSFPAFAQKAAQWLETNKSHPKEQGTTFCLLAACMDPARPSFGVQVYDPLGEEHAKGKDGTGLGWIWDIPGLVMDGTRTQSFREIIAGADRMAQMYGKMNNISYSPLAAKVDESMMHRAWEWYTKVTKEPAFQNPGTSFVFGNEHAGTGSGELTAWPRSQRTFTILLNIGFGPQDTEEQTKALREKVDSLLLEGAEQIVNGNGAESSCLPNFPLEFLDKDSVYKGNYPRLRQLRMNYDPRLKFNRHGVNII